MLVQAAALEEGGSTASWDHRPRETGGAAARRGSSRYQARQRDTDLRSRPNVDGPGWAVDRRVVEDQLTAEGGDGAGRARTHVCTNQSPTPHGVTPISRRSMAGGGSPAIGTVWHICSRA